MGKKLSVENAVDDELSRYYEYKKPNILKEVSQFTSTTMKSLSSPKPVFDQIKEFYTKKDSRDRYGAIQYRSGQEFMMFQSSDSEQYRIVQRASGSDQSWSTAYECSPDEISQGLQIIHFYPSDDGKILAVMFNSNGSDDLTIKFIDLSNGATLREFAKQRFCEITWYPDGEHFIINRFVPSSDGFGRYYVEKYSISALEPIHTYGIWEQKDDVIPYTTRPYPGDVVFLKMQHGTDNKNSLAWMSVSEDFGFHHIQDSGLGLIHPICTYYSEVGLSVIMEDWTNTKFGKITCLKLSSQRKHEKEVLVPEASESIISACVNENIIACHYSDGFKNKIFTMDLSGESKELVWEEVGESLILYSSSTKEGRFFLSVETITSPEKVVVFNVNSSDWSPIFGWNEGAPFEVNKTQVEVCSKDGTPIKISIYGVGEAFNKPVLIYVYGGYGVVPDPYYSPLAEYWISNGGVCAIAHVRGGGEFGQSWADAGKGTKIENSFQDLRACAIGLVELGVASTISVHGHSHGGMMICGAYARWPNLFSASAPSAAVTDLINFTRETIGRSWIKDCGDPDNISERKLILNYSPLHQLQEYVDYPPILLMTSLSDDRVHPWHSLKFFHKLNALSSSVDHLLFCETDVGHSASQDRDAYTERMTIKTMFLAKHSGLMSQHHLSPKLS